MTTAVLPGPMEAVDSGGAMLQQQLATHLPISLLQSQQLRQFADAHTIQRRLMKVQPVTTVIILALRQAGLLYVPSPLNFGVLNGSALGLRLSGGAVGIHPVRCRE
jgi:hypothetical protein